MIGKLKYYLAIAGGVAAIVAPTVGLVYYFARLEGTITKLTDRVVVLEKTRAQPVQAVCADLITRTIDDRCGSVINQSLPARPSNSAQSKQQSRAGARP